MKALIPLVLATGALIAVPAFAQDTAVPPGYVAPGYAPGYVTTSPGYVTSPAYVVGNPGYASGPLGIRALPFQIAALPFQAFVPANGALVGPTSTAVVPANPDCGVWHDWNGRYTSMCGL
jgi:hypothetical protein